MVDLKNGGSVAGWPQKMDKFEAKNMRKWESPPQNVFDTFPEWYTFPIIPSPVISIPSPISIKHYHEVG